MENLGKSALGRSAGVVQQALADHGLPCRVVELPDSTRTAQEAADAIGCEVRQIAKSIVFRAQHSGRPILVVACGSNRIDEKRIARLIDEPIGKASPELVREATGFVIGGVPPVGHAREIETFIDEDLLELESIWAAAGTPHAVFELTPADLVRVTRGRVTPVAPA